MKRHKWTDIKARTKPETRRRIEEEAQRLSGSCPMIFTWDGKQFRFITDVLGVALLGASAGDGQFFPVDHDEYIQTPGDAMNGPRLRIEHALEQRPKRRRINKAPRHRQRRSAARQETSAPPRGARGQIAQIDAEHILDMQTTPDLDEVLEVARKRLLMRSQVRRVDSAGSQSRARRTR